MREKGISKNDYIFCDNAASERIEELKRAGYNVKTSNKEVLAGIDFVKSKTLYIHKNSLNLINEIETYRWKEDGAGGVIDEPVKKNDHALDAMRYAIFTEAERVELSTSFRKQTSKKFII